MSSLNQIARVAVLFSSVASVAGGVAACGWVRDASGVTVEIERRFPGSRVEISDHREPGRRRIEVLIEAPAFGDEVNVAEEARQLAASIHQRYDLRDTDTVTLRFEAKRRLGPVGSAQSARFLFTGRDLAAAD